MPGQSGYHIHVLDVFLFKNTLFGAVAVQDNDLIELFRQLAAAIRVFFNKLCVNGKPFKGLG